MLGDVYLTLAWMAYQRVRYGNARPRGGRLLGYRPPIVTLLRPEEPIAEEAQRRRE